MNKTEIRYLPACELRLEVSGEKPTLQGYAAVFNSLSHDLGGFRERIQPGAFRDALAAQPDVRALVDHNPTLILGRTKSGTLTMTEDERGLLVTITPPDTQLVRDLIENMKLGNIDSMSFAFRTVKDAWSQEEGVAVRDLHSVELFDVSIVSIPAYPDTSVAVRALESWQHSAFDPAKLNTLARQIKQACL